MKKQNKYDYYCVLQGHYGFGWENLTAGTWKEMRGNLKDYRKNEGGHYRIIHRRELQS